MPKRHQRLARREIAPKNTIPTPAPSLGIGPVSPVLCSVKEGMAAIGVCRASFYKEVRAGRIRVRKYGKRSLVETASLRAFAESLPTL